MKFVRNLPVGEYTTIVDAVFGSGLSREVKGSYRGGHREASTAIRRRFLLWISRSGISSDDGSVPGNSRPGGCDRCSGFPEAGPCALSRDGVCRARRFFWISASRKKASRGSFPGYRLRTVGFFLCFPQGKPSETKEPSEKPVSWPAAGIWRSRLSFRKGGSHHGNWPGPGRDGRLQPGDSADTFSGGVLTTEEMLSEETLVNALSWADATGIGPGLSTGEACGKRARLCVLEHRPKSRWCWMRMR